jgi:adenylate kinase
MSDNEEPNRKRPNILVTGTPGVGKTVTAALLAVSSSLTSPITSTIIHHPSTLIFSLCSLFRTNHTHIVIPFITPSIMNNVTNPHQEKTGLRHINVGELIKEHKCYDGHDDTLDTHILDEDKLLDLMEAIFQECEDENVGIVADYHSCELFPERWFDLIMVLRANTEVLYDRLTERGYNEKKRSENVEAEIMQVVLDEAKEAYDVEIVQEVQSNTVEDMESNVERCKAWAEQWVANNA